MIWEDILMSIGSLVGFYKTTYQAYDDRTKISRKATLPDTSIYLLTAVIPMWSLGLYLTAITWTLSFFLKVYIYIYRSPEEEDWLGRSK